MRKTVLGFAAARNPGAQGRVPAMDGMTGRHLQKRARNDIRCAPFRQPG